MIVWGDEPRLAEVIDNLLSNASKFSREGAEIELSVDTHDGAARLIVRDSGAGISPELLPHIFEMFTQGPRQQRTRSGLGLGLALVERLVNLHDGTIEVRSEGEGRGSEFTVTLPLAGARRADDVDRAREESAPRKILVVDDNSDAARALAALLTAQGHEARAVNGAAAALALIDEFQPAIALLDLGMPDMDGYELAQRLRARLEGRDRIRLVALTGFRRDEQRLRAAGFDDYLIKPVDAEQLRKALL